MVSQCGKVLCSRLWGQHRTLAVLTSLCKIIPWRMWPISGTLATCCFLREKTAILGRQIFFIIPLMFHRKSYQAKRQDWKLKLLRLYFQKDSPDRHEPWTHLWYMTKPVINLWGVNSEIPDIFVSSLKENETWRVHLVSYKPSTPQNTSCASAHHAFNHLLSSTWAGFMKSHNSASQQNYFLRVRSTVQSWSQETLVHP